MMFIKSHLGKSAPPNVVRIQARGRGTYLYDSTEKNWNDARTACRNWGSDLAVMSTYQQYEEVLSKIPARTRILNANSGANAHTLVKDIWVGAMLNGPDRENDFKWVSGEPLSPRFSKWAQGEPDPTTQHADCVLMTPINGPAFPGTLGTMACHVQLPFLCCC